MAMGTNYNSSRCLQAPLPIPSTVTVARKGELGIATAAIPAPASTSTRNVTTHLLPSNPTIFLRQLPRSSSTSTSTSTSCFCVACGEGVFGFVYQYSCSKDKKLYLHPCCTNLKLHFRYKDADLHLKDEVVAHDHPQLGTKPCFYCKKIALSVQGQEQGWSYLSIDPVVYRIHVYCSMEMEMEIKKHPADDDESLVLVLDTTKTTYGQYCSLGHQLKLMDGPIQNKKTDFFECDGCKEKGFGHRFRCDTCNFDIHKKCYQPSPTIQNTHFPGDTFNFLPHPPSPGGSCNACGKDVKGYVYHCKDRGWNLHPCCNHLRRKFTLTENKTEILFLLKDHHDPVLTSSRKIKDCFLCKKTTLSGTDKGVPGWSYVSSCGGYRCHVYCFMKGMQMFLRSRETDSLMPISSRIRNGNDRGRRSSNTNGEYYWPFALGLGLIDPTGILLECIYQLFDA